MYNQYSKLRFTNTSVGLFDWFDVFHSKKYEFDHSKLRRSCDQQTGLSKQEGCIAEKEERQKGSQACIPLTFTSTRTISIHHWLINERT